MLKDYNHKRKRATPLHTTTPLFRWLHHSGQRCSSFQCTQITDICNQVTDSSSRDMELSGLFSHLYKTNRNVYGRSNQAQCSRPIQQDVRSRKFLHLGVVDLSEATGYPRHFTLNYGVYASFPQKYQMRRYTLWKNSFTITRRHR